MAAKLQDFAEERQMGNVELEHFHFENALPTAKAGGRREAQAQFTCALSADAGVPLNFDFVKSQSKFALMALPNPASPQHAAEMVANLAQKILADGHRVYFNLDGGLNYLINACVLALAPYEPIFIQSSFWRVTVFDTKTGKYSQIKLPETFSVPQILDLQATPWKQARNNPDRASETPFPDFFAKAKIRLPKICLENVEIDGVVFDLVWNPG